MDNAVLRYIVSCGAITYRWIQQDLQILLVKPHQSNLWGFPKGQQKPNETTIETAIREVYEETGLTIKIIDKIRDITLFRQRQGYVKSITIFLATVDSNNVEPNIKNNPEIEIAQWWSVQNLPQIQKYQKQSFKIALKLIKDIK